MALAYRKSALPCRGATGDRLLMPNIVARRPRPGHATAANSEALAQTERGLARVAVNLALIIAR